MISSGAGAVALYKSSEAPDFAPMAKGGRISMAFKRNNTTGCTPFLIMSANGTSVASTAYLCGLAHDQNPARLVVVKGRPDQGLEFAQAIMVSNGTYDVDAWNHFQLDVITQPTGDVKLIVWENADLVTDPVDTPDFVKVPGMELFTDDAIRTATGTAPLVGGYGGYGFYTNAVGGEGYADYFKLDRQL